MTKTSSSSASVIVPESESLSSVSSSEDAGGVSSDDQSLDSSSTTTTESSNFPPTATKKKKQQASSRIHPDEPNLYLIPNDLSPVYGPLPSSVRVILFTVGILSSIVIAFQAILLYLWKEDDNNGEEDEDGKVTTIHNIIWIMTGVLVNTILFSMVLQEFLTPPSRVTMDELVNDYTLPSTLSRYARFSIPYYSQKKNQSSTTTTIEQGIHYLQYDAPITPEEEEKDNENGSDDNSKHSQYLFEAIYANHGFGANCLAWLPVLPRLVELLGAKVAVGHDATGFGLTDRLTQRDPPTNLQNLFPYTFAGSSKVGTTLLEKVASSPEEVDDDDDQQQKPVILMGQSVGCITTLHMAASLPKSTKKWIILVSPALGVIPTYTAKPGSFLGSTTSLNWVEAIVNACSVVGRYVLRRLVGTNHLVGLILGQVWADTTKLSHSTVLGNQWPTICNGWEDGMLTIGRAILQPVPIKDGPLLEQVLQDKNTTVTVIVGAKDKIVGKRHMRKFMEPYNNIRGEKQQQLRVVEMEGVGHCPAEEDVEGFLKIVETVFKEDKEQILGRKHQN